MRRGYPWFGFNTLICIYEPFTKGHKYLKQNIYYPNTCPQSDSQFVDQAENFQTNFD